VDKPIGQITTVESPLKQNFWEKKLSVYGITFIVCWSLLISFSLGLALYQVRKETIEVVRNVARTNANRDALYRKWNTMHGGVYVQVSENTHASPFLDHRPDWDLTTTSGRKLTLMNAPYMLAQVNDLSGMDNRLKASIKNLDPMLPENSPDAWETAALKTLRTETDEASEVVRIDGIDTLRFMKPLTADIGCMVNRPEQDLHSGDIVGGLSLSVPLTPFQELTTNHKRLIWAGHLSLWFLGLVAAGCTFTKLRQNIKENESLQSQLIQAQKLEAVGRLTGGIAHDFNNLLTAIVGYSELSLMKIPENDALREDIEQIHQAGEKAADLTRQLLAFSRKQVIEKKNLSLNTIIEGIGKMLRRLIREDIELEILTRSIVRNIEADPTQIEQILMNLAVNAKDAMPSGGSLKIETDSVELGQDFFRREKEMRPGRYVLLKVTDTGEGIPSEIINQIFEPFFTTKETGKGTGLGLSTVYGIVKQHDGYINVTSKPGLGTTFRVYFPEREEETQTGEPPERQILPPGDRS
jgi:signal transduction histidine kinase